MPFRQYPPTPHGSALPQPTPERYLVAHIDGGARGNPGPAGYGVLMEDDQGRPVAELFEYLGMATNNYAEYNGLLAALRYVTENNQPALRVLSDSELLVKQLKGEYKVSSPALKQLYDEARAMVRRLDWFSIEHVRRERNKEADALANKAMDWKQPGLVVRRPGEAGSVKPEPAVRECNGVVRDGRVELTAKLPEGARVKVTVVG